MNLLKVWPKLSSNEREWLIYAIRGNFYDSVNYDTVMFTDLERAKQCIRDRYTTWDSCNRPGRITGAGRLYKKLLEAK